MATSLTRAENRRQTAPCLSSHFAPNNLKELHLQITDQHSKVSNSCCLQLFVPAGERLTLGKNSPKRPKLWTNSPSTPIQPAIPSMLVIFKIVYGKCFLNSVEFNYLLPLPPPGWPQNSTFSLTVFLHVLPPLTSWVGRSPIEVLVAIFIFPTMVLVECVERRIRQFSDLGLPISGTLHFYKSHFRLCLMEVLSVV